MMLAAAPLTLANPISTLQNAVAPSQEISLTPVVNQPIVPEEAPPVIFGIASWYSQLDPFINLRTANGELFDDTKMSCASWDFHFGTRLKITNLSNGKSVVCVVNDRGPAKRLGRLVDLTRAAFRKIENPRLGLVKVSVVPIND